MVVREERFAMWGERVPCREREVRFRALTRLLLWHVTPRHSQKWSESFHELSEWDGSSVISVLKARRVSWSVSFPEGVVVAVWEREMRRRMAGMENDQNAQEAIGIGEEGQDPRPSVWLQEAVVL